MLRPCYLQSGDKVALVSPAGAIAPQYVDGAKEVLRSWGLVPVVGEFALRQCGYFAGSDEERLKDMQWALDDEDIKAVFCTRGGYGCMRIVEQLDYSFFQGSPKWIVGCSDVTVFHSKLNTLGVESLHGPMPKSFGSTVEEAMDCLKSFLFGEVSPYVLPPHPFNREGIVQGELTGGNLCLLHCIQGSMIEHRGHRQVLFIEDVGENLYSIDRMMQSLKWRGGFDYLQGVIVGTFSEMKGENFGKDAYEIIRDSLSEYNFPVCFNFPAGHTSRNYPLILGANVDFSVDANGAELSFL